MKIVECVSEIYDVKLRETFKTALREIDSFKVFQIRILDSQGNVGIGECVATPAIVKDNFEDFQSIFDNKIRERVLNGREEEVAQLEIWPSIKSALDCALENLSEPNQDLNIASDVTLPVCEVNAIEGLLKTRIDAGFTVIKVKLDNRALAENIERTRLISEIVEAKATIRIDPNQAWEAAYSIEYMEKLAQFGIEIEYLEQPVSANDIQGLKEVREAGIYEVMADEACFNLDDARRLIDLQACDWINIKLLKSGGLSEARRIANLCKDSGMKVSVGSMLESPHGVIASMKLAHEIAPHLVHDLDAGWWYPSTLLTYVDGKVSTP
jgi:L-alanine-DL-glutamate epimerase-like enolase superfamily enzyme